MPLGAAGDASVLGPDLVIGVVSQADGGVCTSSAFWYRRPTGPSWRFRGAETLTSVSHCCRSCGYKALDDGGDHHRVGAMGDVAVPFEDDDVGVWQRRRGSVGRCGL